MENAQEPQQELSDEKKKIKRQIYILGIIALVIFVFLILFRIFIVR